MPSISRSSIFVAFLLALQAFALVPRVTDPCASQCADYKASGSCTSSLTCQCTATIAQEFQNCVNCVVKVGGTPVVNTTQNTVDVYNEQCAGTNTPIVTVQGGTPDSSTGGSSGQTTGASASITGGNSGSAAVSVTGSSSAQAGGAAATGTVKKSSAFSSHQVLSGGSYVLAGSVMGMVLAI